MQLRVLVNNLVAVAWTSYVILRARGVRRRLPSQVFDLGSDLGGGFGSNFGSGFGGGKGGHRAHAAPVSLRAHAA